MGAVKQADTRLAERLFWMNLFSSMIGILIKERSKKTF